MGLIVAISLVVYFTDLTVADLFSSILAFIPTGWAILCVSYKYLIRIFVFLLNIKLIRNL